MSTIPATTTPAVSLEILDPLSARERVGIGSGEVADAKGAA